MGALRRRQAPPQADAGARARAIAPDVESGNVYLPGMANAEGSGYDPLQTPGWVCGLVDECAAFPNAAHDDRVDALSQALLRLAGSGTGHRQKGGAGTESGRLRRSQL